jgi:hypothetical protein
MIVKAGMSSFRYLQVGVEVSTKVVSQLSEQVKDESRNAYLNCLSSSITCMPCSYCSVVGTSPTLAKCLLPLIVMMEGAVGNFVVADGRLSPVGDDILYKSESRSTRQRFCAIL